MFWNEEPESKQQFVISDDIQDVVFSIQGRSVPLEHAHALANALQNMLPWLAEEELAGIHQIYGAESGNGWLRPDDTMAQVMYLSRRQKLTLRLPKQRLTDIEVLVGQTLDIADHTITIGKFSTRLLSDFPVMFARNVVAKEVGQTETEFMQQAAEQLMAMGITVRKMMCGKARKIHTPDGDIITCSMMLADLEKPESILLQERGLGEHRKLGCGLFLPQKGIDAVNSD